MSAVLDTALARLKDFRGNHDPDDVIDVRSGLTAADLDTVLAACKPPSDLEPGGSMDADDLAGMA